MESTRENNSEESYQILKTILGFEKISAYRCNYSYFKGKKNV